MKDKTLYHGSRGGIAGNIEPNSRKRCDFGQGFYMGTKPEQAKTLVYQDSSPIFYTMNFKLSNIPDNKILKLNGMEWAYFVLYNRGRLNSIKDTPIFDYLKHLADNKDVIIGPIADDNMNRVMSEFINNTITDKVLLESIRAINYGTQYVAKTQKACDNIEICLEEELDMNKIQEYDNYVRARQKESIQKVDAIKKKYRRKGKYLDEVLETINKTYENKLRKNSSSREETDEELKQLIKQINENSDQDDNQSPNNPYNE